MSTTLTRPAPTPGRTTPGLRLDPVGHRRRPVLAVGSVALIVACLAVFVSAYTKAGSQVSVLALVRSVPQGQIVTGSDLTTVRVSASVGIATVPAADASAVVGRRAAELLQPETLLSMNELVSDFAPPHGQSIVGLALKEGQLPASGVAPGETVEVILTGLPGAQDSAAAADSTDQQTEAPVGAASTSASTVPTDASGGQAGLAGTVLVPAATVLESTPSPASSDTGDIDVSLLTPTTLAPFVASASVAGEVALVVVRPPT
jgi:hypothetical protein